MGDGDESAASGRKRLNRGGVWGLVLGGLILFGFGVYAALPLLFGTQERGRVGDCTEHVSYGRSRSTSYRCDVQLAGGSTRTVTFDTSKSYGETVTVTMWGGQIAEVGEATLQSWLFGGGGLVLTAGGVLLLRRTPARAPRKRGPRQHADGPSE